DRLADPGSIFLELGQSGGAHPADPASVQSLLSRALQSATDVAKFDDLRPFTVSVLHPGRTLIEKLLRMNNFSQASDSERDAKGWPRIGRQFYDVWALLGPPLRFR
ncbi:MAG: nucleotidyl transferase AbiEii/AbiGii toxin family protein, partial [Actinobacteria bacterium]|nr:nucleotidyl transferase AbiEii/AbiGii toxin family protein [Actinomycetota bacterium]